MESRVSAIPSNELGRKNHAMLTTLYIDALLVNASRADHIWQTWYDGAIDDKTAASSWAQIAATRDRANYAKLRPCSTPTQKQRG